MNKTVVQIAILLLLAVALVTGVFYVLATSWLREQAVNNCMRLSLVEWQDSGKKGTNFVPEWYKNCLYTKGYLKTSN